MTNSKNITGHMIVRNEDCFVRYAIESVLPFIDQLIIYDTGSTDKTVEIIQSIKSDKIFFEKKGKVTPEELVTLRREQIAGTKTEFFLIIDGDEIWPEKNIEKFIKEIDESPREKIAFFCRTRNCVGDIYHYLPEDAGKYSLAGKIGHLNIRAYRKIPELSISGSYPLEYYSVAGKNINNLDDSLQFVDTWYLHTTNLNRSSRNDPVANRKNIKYELGIKMKTGEIPEVLTKSELPKRDSGYLFWAILETPLKRLRRWLC